jgi:hypothetical protein
MRDVSFVANEIAKEPLTQRRDGMTVIHIARSEAKCEDLSLVVDHQVEFEAEKPARGGFAALRESGKDLVAADARILAHRQGS